MVPLNSDQLPLWEQDDTLFIHRISLASLARFHITTVCYKQFPPSFGLKISFVLLYFVSTSLLYLTGDVCKCQLPGNQWLFMFLIRQQLGSVTRLMIRVDCLLSGCVNPGKGHKRILSIWGHSAFKAKNTWNEIFFFNFQLKNVMLDMCFMACLSILKWLPITLQPRVVYILGDKLQERKKQQNQNRREGRTRKNQLGQQTWNHHDKANKDPTKTEEEVDKVRLCKRAEKHRWHQSRAGLTTRHSWQNQGQQKRCGDVKYKQHNTRRKDYQNKTGNKQTADD